MLAGYRGALLDHLLIEASEVRVPLKFLLIGLLPKMSNYRSGSNVACREGTLSGVLIFRCSCGRFLAGIMAT